MACRSRTRGRAFRGGVASGRTVRNRLPCGPVRQQAPDCRLEEIVAAGHDEQWRQVDVERQASAVRNFGSAASMRRRIRRPASVRVRCGDSDRSYGQFASHGFQRCGTVGTAHRSGTGETNARRLIHAECGSGFGIVFNRQRQHGQRAACRIAGEEHGVRINRIISQMRLDPTQCRLNVRQLTPQIGLRGRSVVQ